MEDGSACALWLSVPAEGHTEAVEAGSGDGSGPGHEGGGEDGPARVREAVDPANERVELIGRLTMDIHPTGRAHAYLWMIAVAPERQSEGLGATLIESALDRCDREGLPAYLEASSSRSRALYERLGFTLTGRPLDLPQGPQMWPMWREPRHGGPAPAAPRPIPDPGFGFGSDPTPASALVPASASARR